MRSITITRKGYLASIAGSQNHTRILKAVMDGQNDMDLIQHGKGYIVRIEGERW